MKKIALLTKYGLLAASTRQRFQQYEPYLEAQGFELELVPLFDDQYLEHLYEDGGRNPARVAVLYFNRLKWLLRATDVDIIWLHCELFPYLPGLAEMLARVPNRPIIFDYDDAVFHNYDLHPNPIVRAALSDRVRVAIGGSELAFCGNEYLADYARPTAKRVEIIPTVVNTDIYRPEPSSSENRDLRIGWIGTPSTWTEYVVPKLPIFLTAAEDWNARFSVMGAAPNAAPHARLDIAPWSEGTEIGCIQGMDVGVMPLLDTPWARGKCGYKLIQYMACGLPVVASPVGVNCKIVEHGVNGFLVETDAEWATALDTLMADPELRRRMGVEGRKKVERDYSLQSYGPKVAELLFEVARTKSVTRP